MPIAFFTSAISFRSPPASASTALLAEVGTFPAYFVSQKGGFDTLTLLDQPSRMFPTDLASKMPEAMFDIGEAGKALCYETPTACGFHVFRAVETVLRRYYHNVTGSNIQPKVRNIAVYIYAMRQKSLYLCNAAKEMWRRTHFGCSCTNEQSLSEPAHSPRSRTCSR
ncbi:MAG: hypothetical protein ABSE67_19720 [Xanthobacteraceae bacterium]